MFLNNDEFKLHFLLAFGARRYISRDSVHKGLDVVLQASDKCNRTDRQTQSWKSMTEAYCTFTIMFGEYDEVVCLTPSACSSLS